MLEIQALLNGWIVDKNKKPELHKIQEKSLQLLSNYKVNDWAKYHKYAIRYLENDTPEFKQKLQNKKAKLEKKMNNDKLKNMDIQKDLQPLAGLQGTTIYKSKMPVWVNRLKEFYHKENKIKSYQKDQKIIVNLLQKIQTDLINLSIRKADKGSELIDNIQHFLIDTIKQKKWVSDKAKKLAKKAMDLIKNYKVNPSSSLLRKSLKAPDEAIKQSKNLKADYKYKSIITAVAHGKPVPPLTSKSVKKKS